MRSTFLQHCSSTMRVHIIYFQYVAPPGECYYNTLLCCDYFSSSSVVLHAFSALCMYSKFRHHPHPQATFVPNFLHCYLGRGEKSCTESLTQLIWCPRNRSVCFRIETKNRQHNTNKLIQSCTNPVVDVKTTQISRLCSTTITMC